MDIVLLDLNATYVENTSVHALPYIYNIQAERYRSWLTELLRDRYVIMLTTRPIDLRNETLCHIECLEGWLPNEAYFNPGGMRAPEAKEMMLRAHVYPKHGKQGSNDTRYMAIESNTATRAMYAKHGIPAYALKNRSPLFEELCDQIRERMKNPTQLSNLRARRYAAKDLGISYRLINHWTQVGVLPDARDEDSEGWRKFNIAERLWIAIVEELRNTGLPLERIKAIYKSVGEPRLYQLEAAVLMCEKRHPLFLLITNEEAILCDQRGVVITDLLMQFPHCLRININAVYEKMLKDASGRLFPEYELVSILSDVEAEVLTELARKDTEGVRVTKKGGKPVMMQINKAVDNKLRLHDLLNDTPYADITISIENGKKVRQTLTKKVKLK